MKTIYNNVINRYDEMIYNSRPVKFDEFISDKYNKIHVELFNSALNNYYNSLIDNAIDKKFIFEFLRLIESTEYDADYDKYYENFYNLIMSSTNNYIYKITKELSIDYNTFFKELFMVTNNFIDDIKDTIESNEILVSIINELIKRTDISDFRIVYYDRATYLAAEEDQQDSLRFGDEFLSYILTQESNGDINVFKTIQKNLIKTEDDQYVFIFENSTGIRIEYNISGEFVILLDTAKYNDDALKNFNFFNYMTNTNKSILSQFKEYAMSLYKKNHKIVEIKNSEYWMPSSIVIISNVSPYVKRTLSLEKYWNNLQSKDEYNISDIKLTDYQVNDSELIELNYVKGIAKMRSKQNDMIFEVPFEYLNRNIDVSDEMSLSLIN